MSCCGQKRSLINVVRSTAGANAEAGISATRTKPDSHAYFQYVGGTALTVLGPVSGKRYRFAERGAIVAVDVRDRRSLATVSLLRQVQRPW